MKKYFLLVLLIFLACFIPATTFAYSTNMNASIVIGQQDFTHNGVNQGGSVGANTSSYPSGVVVAGEKLIVSDLGNHRLLLYNSIPTSNNATANLVIGQPDFIHSSRNQGGTANANTLSGPYGISSDGVNLIASDYSNNRFLVWNRLPTTNNAPADVVIGQPDFVTTSPGTSATKVSGPQVPFYDPASRKLFLSEYNNNRVLIYNSIPTSNNAPADVVIGQPDFTHGAVNQGGVVAANTINSVFSVKVFQNKLLIADTNNNRILIYNSIPTVNNAPADVVIGQTDFSHNDYNQGLGFSSPTAYTLSCPTDLAFDGVRLFVTDGCNMRVLVFDGIPTTNNTSAVQVIGQQNLTSAVDNQNNTLANTFGFWMDVSLTAYNNQMFVADIEHHRTLVFNNATTTLTSSIETRSSDTSIRLTYNTTTPTSEYVEYGTTSAYGSVVPLAHNNPRITDHSITISGLSPCTTYHFQVTATDSNLQDQLSGDKTVTTTGTCTGFNSSWTDGSGSHITFGQLTANNAYTTDQLPTFSFTQAEDLSNGLNKYLILLKDTKGNEWTYIDNINPAPESTVVDTYDTDERWTQYNRTNHSISIHLKQDKDKLSPGAYKWKVRVINNKGSSLDTEDRILRIQTSQAIFSSSQLSFPLSLLQIGERTKINYNSYDPSSVPSTVTIISSKPTFYGIANAGTHVRLTLVKSVTTNQGSWDETTNYTTDANAESKFGINVSPALPTDDYKVMLSATNDLGDYVELPTFITSISSNTNTSIGTNSGGKVKGVSKEEKNTISPTELPVRTNKNTGIPAQPSLPHPTPTPIKHCLIFNLFCS